MIKVSIIIPTYNTENYIAEALQSCIHQSMQDIEIIVVDDCGYDRSMEIATEFANKDCRIKILKNKKNQGLFASRINGAMQCSGEYILFLDSDDFLESQTCELTYNLAEQNKSCMVCFNFIRFPQNKIKNTRTFYDGCFLRDEYCHHIIKSISVYNSHWNLCSKLIKREVFLDSLQYLDTEKHIVMAEDALFYCFIVFCCKQITTSSLSLYYYRIHDNSSTNIASISHLKRNLEDEKYVILYLEKFLKTHNLYFAKC